MCGEKRVLSEEAVQKMAEQRITVEGPQFTGYGLGWWIADEYIADGGAYGAIPLIDAPRKFGVVLMLEATSDAGWAVISDIKTALTEVLYGSDPR